MVLFPTIDFAVFFAIVFLAHWLLNPHPRAWKAFMVAASYVFYGWWDWRFVLLLVASTAVAQGGAVMIARAGTDRPRTRRAWLTATVAANLGLLAWFKYYGFLALNLSNALHSVKVHSPLPLLQVALPI